VSRERGVDPGQPLADYVAQLGDRWARGIDHIQKYGPEPRSSCRRPQWNSGTPAARCHLRLFPYPRRLRLLRGPLRAYQASGVRRLLGPLLARTPTLATLECVGRRGLRRGAAAQCCGALNVHTGREAEAQRFARSLIDAFEDAGVDYLVVNAAALAHR